MVDLPTTEIIEPYFIYQIYHPCWYYVTEKTGDNRQVKLL